MTENGGPPLLLSVLEAARLLNIGRGLCYQLVQENRLPHIRLGRRVLISRQALEQWVQCEVAVVAHDGVRSDHPQSTRPRED